MVALAGLPCIRSWTRRTSILTRTTPHPCPSRMWGRSERRHPAIHQSAPALDGAGIRPAHPPRGAEQ
uniref:Uncharacterized protein n=1 Tax=uncultured marine virus TaxID=186617 RepID=A0A0F7L6X4_9VIRU|nr:hypothetical protein [uncultured marine virus]